MPKYRVVKVRDNISPDYTELWTPFIGEVFDGVEHTWQDSVMLDIPGKGSSLHWYKDEVEEVKEQVGKFSRYKFKVGNRVKIKSAYGPSHHDGKIGTITEIDHDREWPYRLDVFPECIWHETELELVEEKENKMKTVQETTKTVTTKTIVPGIYYTSNHARYKVSNISKRSINLFVGGVSGCPVSLDETNLRELAAELVAMADVLKENNKQ